MFPKEKLEELGSEIDQMIDDTSSEVRKAELKNIKTTTEHHVRVLNGQITVDDIKGAVKIFEESRERIAALKADPNSAGLSGAILRDEE